jgi:DNA-binding XRE family transcriptional regulator
MHNDASSAPNSPLYGDITSYIMADMTNLELNHCLEALSLTQADLAARLGVTPRTVRRWQAGEQPIPTWIAEVLGAWRQLHAHNLPWGADLESIWYGDDDQIRRHQDHDAALAALLRRVKARGGPAAPWRVNLREHRATLGPMIVRFYRLASDSFSLANYRRADVPPDVHRDQPLIEDAVAAFAASISAARTARPNQAWDE